MMRFILDASSVLTRRVGGRTSHGRHSSTSSNRKRDMLREMARSRRDALAWKGAGPQRGAQSFRAAADGNRQHGLYNL